MLVPGENFEIRTHLPSLVHLLTIISLEFSFFLSFFHPLVFPFILLMQVKLISQEKIQHTNYSGTLPPEFQNMQILNAHLANTSVSCAVGPSVTTSSTDFSFQNLFFGIYLNFQQQKSLKNQYLPHSESKSHQINSIKSCSSRSFHSTKGTFQFLRNFQLRFNFISSEEIIQYSRTFALQVQTSWNQACAPLLVEGFPKIPRTQCEASWFSGCHKYKQNKNTSFLHRQMVHCSSFLLAGSKGKILV